MAVTGSALLLVAALAPPARAAAWREIDRPDLGYRLQFPGQPVESRGIFNSITVVNAPTHVETVKTETGLFAATVVDLQNRREDGASIMGDTEFLLALLGDVTDVSVSRLPPGRGAVFGRFITLIRRKGRIPEQPGQTDAAEKWFKDATGLEVPEGALILTNMYFRNGRLYLFQGVNPPDDQEAPEGVRFVQSLDWSPRPPTEGGNLPAGAARPAPE